MAPAGFASGMPMAGALSGVFMPPLWLLLGLTMGLALHVALLHLLANFPLVSSPHRRNRGRGGGPLTRRWPLALCAGVLFLLAAVALRLPDIITQPLLWLGLLFNLGATFVTLSDAVWGAVAGYLTLWCINGVYRLARR